MRASGLGDLATAFGLMLVMEGVLLAVLPEQLKRLLAATLSRPTTPMRILGLTMAAAGLGIVWLIRG